eukprot:SM000163S02340  [mRNA]  locus=s163:240657:242179:- [translate_table: standard]
MGDAAPSAPHASLPQRNLKYLGFFQDAVLKAVAYLTTLYDYAKDSSGPLKPGLENVEGTVKTIVGPVYNKIDGKPGELLQFVDAKVDKIFTLLDKYVPPYFKEKANQAATLVKEAPANTKALFHDVQSKGFFSTVHEYTEKYQPVAEKEFYSAWKFFLTFPLAPQVVSFVAPTAIFGAEKYNEAVVFFKKSDIPIAKPVAGYLPLVPTEKIESTVKSDTQDALKVNGITALLALLFSSGRF